jgi:serine protease Do
MLRRCLLGATCLALLLLETATGADNPISRRNAIVEAVRHTKKSIVTVRVPRPNTKDSIGTGVIVDERGFIVTNRHVIGAARDVVVRLVDDSEHRADVVMAEPSWDLAVLRIKTKKKLAALPLAPVDDLMVGESVIAVGHPFGYSHTVSVGIISALGREITMPSGDVLHGLIQTDASINPGNSGGPLLNINGEFIGVNVALRDGAQGIAFAINAGTVKDVLRQHFSASKVAGVQHGIACKEKTLSETGARQRVVVAGFEGQGVLRQGDEILAVGSSAVVNAFDVERAFWSARPGEQVELRVVREGKEMNVTLTLAASNGAGQATAHSARTPSGRQVPLTTVGVPAANQR